MLLASATDYEKTYQGQFVAPEGVYGHLQLGVYLFQRLAIPFTLLPTVQNRKWACVRKSDPP